MPRAVGSHINWRIKLTQKTDPKNWLTIQEYAKQYHLTESGVRYRIATYKLRAMRHKGRWYVDPTEPPQCR